MIRDIVGGASILGPFLRAGKRRFHAEVVDSGGAAVNVISCEIFGSVRRPSSAADWLGEQTLTSGPFGVPASLQTAAAGMFSVDGEIDIPEGVRWLGFVILTTAAGAYDGYVSVEDD